MKVITGRVVDGKIELETQLEEGTAVAILTADEGSFRLTSKEEEELVSALAAVRRGEYVDGHELLAELKGLKRG